MIKMIKIEDTFINLDKVIQIYEAPASPTDKRLVTVIEFEGFQTGNTGYNGETPYYTQNQIRTRVPINKIIDKVLMMNTLDELRKRSFLQPFLEEQE